MRLLSCAYKRRRVRDLKVAGSTPASGFSYNSIESFFAVVCKDFYFLGLSAILKINDVDRAYTFGSNAVAFGGTFRICLVLFAWAQKKILLTSRFHAYSALKPSPKSFQKIGILS